MTSRLSLKMLEINTRLSTQKEYVTDEILEVHSRLTPENAEEISTELDGLFKKSWLNTNRGMFHFGRICSLLFPLMFWLCPPFDQKIPILIVTFIFFVMTNQFTGMVWDYHALVWNYDQIIPGYVASPLIPAILILFPQTIPFYCIAVGLALVSTVHIY